MHKSLIQLFKNPQEREMHVYPIKPRNKNRLNKEKVNVGSSFLCKKENIEDQNQNKSSMQTTLCMLLAT